MDRFELLKKFSGGAAHDINNMLTGIMGYLVLMQEELDKDSELNAYVDGINKAATKARDLTDKMTALNFKRSYEKIENDVTAMLARAIEEVRKGLPEAGPIENEMSDLSPIHADDKKLTLALMWSIGYIACRAGKGVSLTVEDADGNAGKKGIKISVVGKEFLPKNDDLPDAFEPAYTTGEHLLMGCEMAAAREIISDHDGTISVQKDIPNRVTCNIWLPSC